MNIKQGGFTGRLRAFQQILCSTGLVC